MMIEIGLRPLASPTARTARGVAELLCQAPVRGGRAVRDAQQGGADPPLKGCATCIEPQLELFQVAGEVRAQLLGRVGKRGIVALPRGVDLRRVARVDEV